MKNMVDNKFDKLNYNDGDGDDDDDDYDYDNDEKCDLNVTKLCDSCGKCLELDKSDFRVVRIEGIAPRDLEIDEYILEEATLDENIEEDNTFDALYIEDIPVLREEYDKEIDKLLGRE
jgi:hypothetical protein